MIGHHTSGGELSRKKKKGSKCKGPEAETTRKPEQEMGLEGEPEPARAGKDWGVGGRGWRGIRFTWCEEPVDGPAQGEMCSNLHSRSHHLSSILSFVSVTPRVTIFRSWQASVNSYSHSWVIRQKKNSILFQLVMKVENLAPDTQGTQSSGVSGDLASCFLFSCFFFLPFFSPP